MAVAAFAQEKPAGLAEAEKFFQRGNQFTQKNSLARAKAEYQKALKLYPRHLDALYNLAVVCQRLNQKDEALAHYKRYLELAPQDADGWTQLGVLYDEMGKKDEALEAYGKAISANPGFGRAHHNLGVLLKERGRYREAEGHLLTFVRLEEEAGRHNGHGYYSLGVLYLAQLRAKQAKLWLQKAIDTDPSVAHFNNAMGDAYLLEKRPELSVVYYKKALEKDPKYALAYSGLGDAHAQMGQSAKAAEAYRKALELRPDYGLVHYKLGRLFEETNPAEATKHFENYLRSGKNLQHRDEVAAKLENLKQKQP